MNPQLRLWLAGALGIALGAVGGVGIANQSYMLTALVLVLVFWVIAERYGRAWPDTWLLAGALIGYIVGNRGFAQLLLTEQPPLLPAEAVLLVAIPMLGVRMACKYAAGLRWDGLNCALLFWILLGAARLPIDLRRYGFLALRDFAMVYYAAFFFIGQAAGSHAASARLLRHALTVAFTLLPVAVIAGQFAPDFFLSSLTVRGTPLIYQKSDLASASLAAGFFWLWTRWERRRWPAWLVPAAASLLLIGTMASPRAAMVALTLTTLFWLVAGRRRVAIVQAGLIGMAALGVIAMLAFTDRDIRQTTAYSAYEHAVSIFDLEGRGDYLHTASGDLGDNNRFRLTWWHAVAQETLEQSPVFGLGFGYDLTTRFLADYDLVDAEDFSARSPHSMIMSVFGRMGFAGLVLWVMIMACIVRLMWRILKQGASDAIGLISVAWVILVSACFGVVLEGPMGAVVFWTVLGLANASTPAQPAATREKPVAETAAETLHAAAEKV
jgi:O-antigen ligase